jgi:hypothetical protein
VREYYQDYSDSIVIDFDSDCFNDLHDKYESAISELQEQLKTRSFGCRCYKVHDLEEQLAESKKNEAGKVIYDRCLKVEKQLADKDKTIEKLLRQAVDPYRVEGRWVHNCDTCKLPKEIENLKWDKAKYIVEIEKLKADLARAESKSFSPCGICEEKLAIENRDLKAEKQGIIDRLLEVFITYEKETYLPDADKILRQLRNVVENILRENKSIIEGGK